jgi:hypothetical protein
MSKEIGTNWNRFTIDSRTEEVGQSVEAIAPTVYLLHESFNIKRHRAHSCEKVENDV